MVNIIVFLKINQFYARTQKIRLGHAANLPLVVCRDGYVLDACRAAVQSNVVTGIRTVLARRRCPALRVVEYDSAHYAEPSFEIWQQFAALTPRVEPCDECSGFLDLSGCIPHGTSANEIMTRACVTLYQRTGFLADWGGGQDRWMAKLACGENGWIAPDAESTLLKWAALKRLGLGDDLCSRLQRYGIRTIGDILNTPRGFIESHLQVPGRELDPFLVRGDSIVAGTFPPREIRLSVDLDDSIDGDVERAIAELARRAEQELSIGGRQTAQLVVTVHDRGGEHERIWKLAKSVWARAGLESLLVSSVQELQASHTRRITLRLRQLTDHPYPQTDLWQRANQRAERLEQAAQALAGKFGTVSMQTGRNYAEQVQPRFAQLICRERNMFLP